MNIVSVSNARADLPNLVDRVSENLEEYVITKQGAPKAVLISAEEYESWKETVDVLSDSELVKKIERGLSDISKGHTVPLRDIL